MADVYKAIALALQVPGIGGRMGLPVFLWGPPGAGKTSRINAVCEALSLHFQKVKKSDSLRAFTVIAGLREPSDFAGLPKVTAEGVQLLAPAWAVDASKSPNAVIFLDEGSCAPPAVQKAMLRAIFEGVVGDLQMPPTVRWLASGNPPEQGADAYDLAPPFANRFIHLDVELSTEQWRTWLMTGGSSEAISIPHLDVEAFEQAFRQTRALADLYVSRFPGELLKVPKEETAQGRAWPSPRSWEMGLRGYAAGLALGTDEGNELGGVLLTGAIGVGAAGQFLAWAREQDLPDPRAVLKNPEQWSPDRARLDRSIATLSACAAEALEQKVSNEKERDALVEQAWKLIQRAHEAKVPDVAIPAAIVLCSKRASAKRGKVEEDMLFKLAPMLQQSGYFRT